MRCLFPFIAPANLYRLLPFPVWQRAIFSSDYLQHRP
nr:MAG TPA_asm: hypothetical protein [Caudoviricetes sp.]